MILAFSAVDKSGEMPTRRCMTLKLLRMVCIILAPRGADAPPFVLRVDDGIISYMKILASSYSSKLDRDMSQKTGAAGSATDLYGEVFTPPVLIHELLDALPPAVWTDPAGKWLDPCAGQGNFLDEILPRLMAGLADQFDHDDAACRRHILEHMVLQVEKNPANVRILRRKYGARAHIVAGDFLALTASDLLLPGPRAQSRPHPLTSPLHAEPRFDVVVANPPYQAPKTATYAGSAGNRTLWDQFVRRGLELASETGVLGFITPANWRRPAHPLWSALRERLLYLHIYHKQDGMALFKVQTRFDLYVVAGTARPPEATIPLVIDERGVQHRATLHPRDWPFFPNFMYRILRPLIVQDADAGLAVLHDASTYDARKLTQRPTTAHPYPVVHTLTKKGVGLRYAAERDPRQFGVPKLILNVNEKQYPVNDWQGKYGMSQLSFGIPVRSRAEGERWMKCMASPVFADVLRATKWGSFQTDHRMFSYFRPDFCERLMRSEDRYSDRYSGSQRRTKKRTRRVVPES